jgi:hypothetical protein
MLMRMTSGGRLSTLWDCVRVPIALALVVGAGSCSGGTARSGVPGSVPVPQISVPSFAQPISVSDWQWLWTNVPGSMRRQCVAVRRGETTARSDSFAVGNFVSYLQSWDGTANYTKLAYIPLYPDQDQPLTLSVSTLDGQPVGPFAGLAGTSFAWGENGIPFYATGTFLPHRGRWRLVATAGRNWGCFDLTI